MDFLKSTSKFFMKNLNASEFFPKYAPNVKNWKSKLRGYYSNKKVAEFTKNDDIEILAGIKKMTRDFFLSMVENEK